MKIKYLAFVTLLFILVGCSDVGYQFDGKDLTASGLEENLGAPVRDIKQSSGPKYLENEDFPIPVHIQWNEDQEETVYLQKL